MIWWLCHYHNDDNDCDNDHTNLFGRHCLSFVTAWLECSMELLLKTNLLISCVIRQLWQLVIFFSIMILEKCWWWYQPGSGLCCLDFLWTSPPPCKDLKSRFQPCLKRSENATKWQKRKNSHVILWADFRFKAQALSELRSQNFKKKHDDKRPHSPFPCLWASWYLWRWARWTGRRSCSSWNSQWLIPGCT